MTRSLFDLGYGVGTASGPPAPPTISYDTPQSWTYGVAITPLSPTSSGASSFAEVGTVLADHGLALNAATGEITGTPDVAMPAADVTIRATGAGGTADATINVTIPSPLFVGLKAYFDADEASGDLIDHHSSHDFTDQNTVGQAAGVGGGQNARLFAAASSEYFSHANHADLVGAAGAWSRWGWAYVTAGGVLFIADCNNGVTGWSIYVQGGVLRSLVGTGSANVTLAHGPVPGSSWVFWYVEFDGANLRASTNDGTMGTAVAAAHAPSAAGVNIGAALGPSLYFNGRKAAIGFADRVLTPAEITWLRNAGSASRSYASLATYDGG